MTRTAPPMPGVIKPDPDAMIRVDHAGELGAVQIYRGQRAVFAHSSATTRTAEIIRDMEEGEAEHLRAFDKLVAERHVRPTALAPFWRVAGYGLGAATALMGEKVAHACTAAVEEVIQEHYAQQSAALEDGAFKTTVDRFRVDEIAHKDKAIEEGAREAPAYGLLSRVIKFGCRAAIRLSEKI
jgi:ubiquinone biosynthesis monooxygenase Coq7